MEFTEHPAIERRNNLRLECQSPLMFKVCKETTISKLMEGYARDVSRDGMQCTIPEKVPVGCTLWLKLDRDILKLCEEIDKRAVILQQGILGKVMWVTEADGNKFNTGLQFIVREEKH